MKKLIIKSKGEISEHAISLIGASTKRGDDSTIGMFGSGLKYAIASILRQGLDFQIFTGLEKIEIVSKKVVFREKEFNRIYVNGSETSLTDSMGTEDWKGVFPFIREIYSNALDEDKDAFIGLIDGNPPIEKGYTVFVIEANDDVVFFMSRFDNYFLNKDFALFKNERGGIYGKREHVSIFRKGILAYESRDKSLFTYDLEDIEINESRVVKSLFSAQTEIGYLIESCTNKRILRLWINGLKGGNAGLFEHECILADWYSKVNNPALVEVILENEYYPVEVSEFYDENEKLGRIPLPLKLLKRFMSYAPDLDVLGLTSKGERQVYVERTPTETLFDKVSDAVQLLKRTSYKERLVDKIRYCKFFNSRTLGFADDETIWLSVKLDTYSIDEIAKIIIEEQEHLTTGYGDETREFQNHLFNLLFTELTRKK